MRILLLLTLLLPLTHALSIDYTPPDPTTSTSIHFMANITENITPVMYVWLFGDGSYKTGVNSVYHRYREDGNYTVILIVTGKNGEVMKCNVTVRVNNTPPVADFEWDIQHPNPGDVIHFIDKSYDPDGEIVRWKWIFGDGGSTTMHSISHVFIDVGEYNITLIVWDDDNASSSKTKVIKVEENKPPNAVFIANTDVITAGGEIIFYDQSFDTDGEIVRWQWDFGDGYGDDSQNTRHVFKKKGEYTVTLTVWDDDNASASYSMRITVVGKNKSIGGFGFVAVLVAFLVIMYHKLFYSHQR